jgi:hypothetical protein
MKGARACGMTVPWGDSMYARKFRDIIAAPRASLAISITFHRRRRLFISGHRTYQPNALICGPWDCTATVWVVRWSNDLLYVGYVTTLHQMTLFSYSDVWTKLEEKLQRGLSELKSLQVLTLYLQMVYKVYRFSQWSRNPPVLWNHIHEIPGSHLVSDTGYRNWGLS